MINFEENLHSLDDLSAIYLLLGRSCNMSCRHCSQIPIKPSLSTMPVGGHLSQDVKNFIIKWNRTAKRCKPKRIYFWGGEPLLYWKTIKKLVLEFNSIGINADYIIYSNGLLLNNGIVDFLNEYNMRFILSYDAPNPTAVRNIVPDDSKCELFLKIRKRSLNTVYNALNNDMVAAIRFLENKFPNTKINCGYIFVLSDIPKFIYTFEKGATYRAVRALEKLALTGNANAANWFTRGRKNFTTFDKEEFEEYPYPRCHPGVVSISVDFSGNVTLCHNTNKIIGHITDDFAELQDKHLSEFKRLLPPKCKTCEVLDMCRCDCPIAVKENGELCYCDYLREMWQAAKDVINTNKLTTPAKTYKMNFTNNKFVIKEVVKNEY